VVKSDLERWGLLKCDLRIDRFVCESVGRWFKACAYVSQTFFKDIHNGAQASTAGCIVEN